MADREKPRRGRPRGSAPYDAIDGKALVRMHRLCQGGMTVARAAQRVARDLEVPGASEVAIVSRLAAKYRRKRSAIEAELERLERAADENAPSGAAAAIGGDLRGQAEAFQRAADFFVEQRGPERARMLAARLRAMSLPKGAGSMRRLTDLLERLRKR